MKKRILLIMNTSKKRISLAVLCGILVVTATLVSGSVFALGVNGTEIEKAKEIALAEAGGGTVVQCELEYENGVQVYEIKVINGDTEYELDIGVEDYAIYKSEAKTIKKKSTAVLPAASDITSDKAQEIALEKTSGGEVTKWELDYKDGIKVYEIEVINGSTKYSMEIGAVDGQVYNYKEKLAKTNAESQSPKKTLPETVITAEKAKEIAIAETGGGTVKEYELDYEKGVWIYEIEVILDKTEYEAEINAETGEILKFKTDD